MRPLLIGIAGGSGSGKTTIAQRVRATLARSLPPAPPSNSAAAASPTETRAGATTKGDPHANESVVIVEHDSYYRDRTDLTYEERCQLNFDHPDSLDTPLLVEHLKALKRGEAVDVPIYDFKHHRRAVETKHLRPTGAIIVEGILVFAEPALRDQLDVKIYVDTDADIRAFRRIRRDIEQRGRTFDSVREQYYKTVRPMHLLFVEPSKRYADVIIPEGGENRIGVELVTALVERIRVGHLRARESSAGDA